MQLPSVILLCLSTFCVSYSHAQVVNQTITALALVYGSPLLQFQLELNTILKLTQINEFYHAPALSTAANRAVVKPNVDTLYSTLIFDLSENDISITVPEIPQDQFHLFSYFDPYGDNFANSGTGNLDVAGDYLLRPMLNGGESVYGIANDTTGQYIANINSPTTYGTLLIRWLVYNETSYELIHALQNATMVKTIPRAANTQTTPTLSQIEQQAQQQSGASTPAEDTLKLLAAFAPNNPPELTIDTLAVAASLSAAGISNGTYTPPAGLNITQANNTALLLTEGALAVPGTVTNLGNGWKQISPSMTGDFKSNFGLRAAIASSGYLMLKAPNAEYPSWSNSSSGSSGAGLSATDYPIAADESYLYTFSAKPALKRYGFWSLTAYSDEYLIPNPMNVYALGDRSNLTYSDGSRIYGANASQSNVAFQILVQPADVMPPSNWTGNWLPAPAGGGNISVVLRWYGPMDSLSNGGYVYPVVTRQAAITNGSTSGSSSSSSSGAALGRTDVSAALVGVAAAIAACMML